MKRWFVVLMALPLVAGSAVADVSVRGYVRSDGTYVAPHYRSSPNPYRFDNYSASGNINPYTGSRGTGRSELTVPSYRGYGNSLNRSLLGDN